MAGILLGVMSLIVVMSVMNGFERELKQRILGVVPQVVMSPIGERTLADWQEVKETFTWPAGVYHASPFVQSEGLVQGMGQLSAVILQGIMPKHEPPRSVLQENMLRGAMADLTPGAYQVIIGRALAMHLDVQVGDRIRVTAAGGQHQTPVGMMPAQRQFTVVGIFEVGADIDRHLVFAHGEDLARLLRYPAGHVSGVRLWLEDAFLARSVGEQLLRQQERFPTGPRYQLTDWQERYGQLFAAVRMEKGMMMIMLSLIVMVAAFNGVSALVMLIQDKRADIAVLQTLGLARSQVYQTLVLQGMYSGVMGAVLGAMVGIALTLGLNDLLLLFGIDIFLQGQMLPYALEWSQIATILLAAFALTFLATVYPAWRAAQLQPAEILRYE